MYARTKGMAKTLHSKLARVLIYGLVKLLTGVLKKGYILSAGIYEVASGAQVSINVTIINPCLERGKTYMYLHCQLLPDI